MYWIHRNHLLFWCDVKFAILFRVLCWQTSLLRLQVRRMSCSHSLWRRGDRRFQWPAVDVSKVSCRRSSASSYYVMARRFWTVSVSLFRLSVSGRCCIDGSSIHLLIFHCSSHSPDTCPHPVLLILLSRSVWPSSVFGLSLSLLVLISPVFGVFSYVRNNVCFLKSSGVFQIWLWVHQLWIGLFCVQSMIQ